MGEFSEDQILAMVESYVAFVAVGRANYPSGKRWLAMEEESKDPARLREIAISTLERARDKPPRVPAVVGPPLYTSWADYLAKTTEAERLAWCAMKAKHAGRKREHLGDLQFPAPSREAVYRVMQRTQGQCHHCGSLALEKRPTGPGGRPASWDEVGRRIGSLDHLVALVEGGDNSEENLGWSCLWCNTWPNQRRRGARDHGAIIVRAPRRRK